MGEQRKFNPGDTVEIEGLRATLVRFEAGGWVVRYVSPGTAQRFGLGKIQPESKLIAVYKPES